MNNQLSINPYDATAVGDSETVTHPKIAGHERFPRSILVVLPFVIAGVAWLSVSTQVPEVYAPYPAVVFIPAYAGGAPRMLIAILAGVTFAGSQLRHFKKQPQAKPNVGFPILCFILTTLTALVFLADWRFGLQYHGASHVIVVGMVNIAFALASWMLWFISRKPHHYHAQVWLGFTLFAWLFWYAVPMIGELP